MLNLVSTAVSQYAAFNGWFYFAYFSMPCGMELG